MKEMVQMTTQAHAAPAPRQNPIRRIFGHNRLLAPSAGDISCHRREWREVVRKARIGFWRGTGLLDKLSQCLIRKLPADQDRTSNSAATR